jgi:predicted DNA-binding transcriptional regulator YafY
VDVTRRLLDATRARRLVSMRYFSASNNRAKNYDVQPYRLALASGGVYLIAWVAAYEEFRTFAISRIERLSVSDETFSPHARSTRQPLQPVDGRVLGRAGTRRTGIRRSVAPFVRGRVWHESQQVRELPDGRLGVVLHVSNDWALRSWLLGFGAGVRVVAPANCGRGDRRGVQARRGLYAATPTPRGRAS